MSTPTKQMTDAWDREMAKYMKKHKEPTLGQLAGGCPKCGHMCSFDDEKFCCCKCGWGWSRQK